MLLAPGEHVKILPGAAAEWNDREHVLELQVHFRNQIPQLVSEIESVYGSLSGRKVLDLGCGPGRLSEAFPNMAFYLGIDQSELMIERAKKRFPQQNFVCNRIEDYRNPNHFDVVTCIDILQHLENVPEQLLRHILMLFDADIFLFRTHVNAQSDIIRHSKSSGEASISYPVSYFANVVGAVNKRTDCTAKMFVTKLPKDRAAGAVYVVCERKPIC